MYQKLQISNFEPHLQTSIVYPKSSYLADSCFNYFTVMPLLGQISDLTAYFDSRKTRVLPNICSHSSQLQELLSLHFLHPSSCGHYLDLRRVIFIVL
jgi:hypothetical protein